MRRLIILAEFITKKDKMPDEHMQRARIATWGILEREEALPKVINSPYASARVATLELALNQAGRALSKMLPETEEPHQCEVHIFRAE